MGQALKKRIGFRRQFTSEENRQVKIHRILQSTPHEFKLHDLSTSGVGISLGKNSGDKMQLEIGELVYLDLTPFGIADSSAVLEVVRFDKKENDIVMGTRFRGLSMQASQQIEALVGLSHMKQLLSKKDSSSSNNGSKDSDTRAMIKTLAREFLWHLFKNDKTDAHMTSLPQRNLTMLVRGSIDTTQLWAESPFKLF